MADPKKDAMEQLRCQVAEAKAEAQANPLWEMTREEMEPLVASHELGSTRSGWKNPYPEGDPRSLLLEYQFVPFHDRSRFKFQLQSRQTGKDFTMQGEIVEDCLSNAGSQWMVAAPTERQALDSLEQGKLWAEAFGLHIEDVLNEYEGNSSQHLLKSSEIIFHNDSRERAVPGKPDNVRGRSASVAITEYDFLENPLATWRALLPSIVNPLRGGEKKCRVVTTPNGVGGAGHKLWTKGDGEHMRWSRHKVTIYQAVLMGLRTNAAALIEAMDDPDGVAQELFCEFLDTVNVLLPYDLIALAESAEASEAWSISEAMLAHSTFLGIDFGRTNDPTVCWTLQRVGDILWTREVLVLENVSTPDQFQILDDRIRAADRVCFDYTGPGIGLGDLMVKKHSQWKPEAHKLGKVELCQFSAKFKRSIFPKLRRAFEAPTKLRIPISTVIREDLHEMKQVISNGEYNYWAARTKEGHSDRCTALALAVRAAGENGGFSFLPHSSGRRTRNKERSVW
ncbi:hypothetical protein OKA04_04655 [Luteolibacter flavescens]|uniref:Terminase large subunit gp17-like C-terminal domain-containing protein n=1 Tax=Luteolibacter flavescens TaxID=1859460 RepID=A0ABT3FKC5_9BACT|nr:hypothetical protein [Luteolibacter flavescens]MCW1884007.1 hypothetical protein [Luteolibacter flavescens]